jgi:hypothetical protein
MVDRQRPPVVVHPPSSGGRRVEIRGHDVGRALRLADVIEFLRRAGLEDPDIEDPTLVEWRGGHSGVWR